MKPIIIYLVVWILLSVVWFFSSEVIVNWILPGVNNVHQWLLAFIIGTIILLVLLLAAFLVTFSRKQKN